MHHGFSALSHLYRADLWGSRKRVALRLGSSSFGSSVKGCQSKDSPYGCRTAADSYRIPHLSFRLPFPILFDRSIINRMNIIQSSAAFIYDIKE